MSIFNKDVLASEQSRNQDLYLSGTYRSSAPVRIEEVDSEPECESYATLNFFQKNDIQKKHEQVAALYDEYYPRISRYLSTFRLELEEIEELVQEVFLRLITQMLEGHEIERPAGWVIRVAHNLAIDCLQKKSRCAQHTTDEERALFTDRPDLSPNPEQQYLEEEQMRCMEKALMRFKLRDRQCFLMRVQGMSYRDIADAMNITEQRAGAIVNKVASRLERICA